MRKGSWQACSVKDSMHPELQAGMEQSLWSDLRSPVLVRAKVAAQAAGRTTRPCRPPKCMARNRAYILQPKALGADINTVLAR